MALLIRHAELKDIDALKSLFAENYKDDVTAQYLLRADTESMEKHLTVFAELKGKEYIKKKEIILVAFKEETLVGFAVLKQGFKTGFIDAIKIYAPSIIKTLFNSLKIVKSQNVRAFNRLTRIKTVEQPVLMIEAFGTKDDPKHAVLKEITDEAMSYVKDSKYFTGLFSVTADMKKKAMLEKAGFVMKDIRQNNDLRVFHMFKAR